MDPVPTTIATLESLDGAQLRLLPALQQQRKPTLTLSTGVRHANAGRLLIPPKLTLEEALHVPLLMRLPVRPPP